MALAHLLATDGTDDYVQLNSPVAVSAGQNYRIEIDFECTDNDAFGVRLLGIPGSDTNRLIIFDGVSANIVFTPLGTKNSGLPVDVCTHIIPLSTPRSGLVDGDTVTLKVADTRLSIS